PVGPRDRPAGCRSAAGSGRSPSQSSLGSGLQVVHSESTSGDFGGTEPAGARRRHWRPSDRRDRERVRSRGPAGTVDAMRFSYAEPLCDPTHYLPLARAVEDAGWDTFIVPDSICYPEVSDSRYPYTPDGNREFLEDKAFIEPFSLIPA